MRVSNTIKTPKRNVIVNYMPDGVIVYTCYLLPGVITHENKFMYIVYVRCTLPAYVVGDLRGLYTLVCTVPFLQKTCMFCIHE